MANEVVTPLEDMFRVSRISLLHEDIEDIYVPGITGTVMESPSSYIAKGKDLFNIPIDWIHPAWLFSGENFYDQYMPGYVVFRSSKVAQGARRKILVENPKWFTKANSLDGIAYNVLPNYDSNIPIVYTGQNLGSTTTPTIVSSWISKAGAAQIAVISPVEATITVPATLTEEVRFAVPVASPRLSNTTIWGEVGNESTLPTGAVVGLTKIKHEVKLSADKGAWLLPADHPFRTYMESQVFSVVTDTRRSGVFHYTTLADRPEAPYWYTNPMSWVPGLTIYQHSQDAQALCEAHTPIFALGYESATNSVGSGLFVTHQNKVRTLPWRDIVRGIFHTQEFTNSSSTPTLSKTVQELMACPGFFNQLFYQIDGALPEVPLKTVLPISAADIQVAATGFMYKPPYQSDLALYQQDIPNDQALVTPLYIPSDPGNHCYSPIQTYSQARLSNVIRYNQLESTVNLALTVASEWWDWYKYQTTTDLKVYVEHDRGMYTVTPDTPLNPVHAKNTFEFYYRTWSAGGQVLGSSPTVYTIEWFVEAGYKNSNPEFTVGNDSTLAEPTAVPVISDMSMMLVGKLPAGTPAGTYQFKPFKSYTMVNGTLNAVTPTFIPATTKALMVNETTEVPYLGLNLITVQTDKFRWYPTTKNDATVNHSHTITQCLPRCEKAINDLPTSTTIQARITLDIKAVPMIGYPLAKRPMVVDVTPDGALLCEGEDVVATAPFYSSVYGKTIVVMASSVAQKLYIVEVEMDDEDPLLVVRYPTLIKTIFLRNTPYGELREIHGIAHTKDINYKTGKEIDAVLLYCGLHDPEDDLTGLAVMILREDFAFDSDKDTILRIPIKGPDVGEYDILEQDVWPKGIAIMYPHAYVLAYYHHNKPVNPIQDTLLEAINVGDLDNNGWQMCLYRVDMLAGLVTGPIILKSGDYFRFNYGLPAKHLDWKAQVKEDVELIGDYAKYNYPSRMVTVINPTTGQPVPKLDASGNVVRDKETGQVIYATRLSWPMPVSTALPLRETGVYPTIAGIFSVSGQLVAIHNGIGACVTINPVTGYIEENGYSLYPFTTPFNQSIGVDARNESVYTTYVFQGKVFQSAHPFMHICIGDGLPPNLFSTSLDIQDASFGETLIRKAKVHNNLVRDEISQIILKVPPTTELPHSDMLWLCATPDGTWVKELTLPGPLLPCDAADFFIKVEPTEEVQEPLTLYLNAQFNRKTVMFGYKFDV